MKLKLLFLLLLVSAKFLTGQSTYTLDSVTFGPPGIDYVKRIVVEKDAQDRHLKLETFRPVGNAGSDWERDGSIKYKWHENNTVSEICFFNLEQDTSLLWQKWKYNEREYQIGDLHISRVNTNNNGVFTTKILSIRNDSVVLNADNNPIIIYHERFEDGVISPTFPYSNLYWTGNRLDSIISYDRNDQLTRTVAHFYEDERLSSSVTIDLVEIDTILESYVYDGEKLSSSYVTSSRLSDSTHNTYEYDLLRETKTTLVYDNTETIDWGRKVVTVFLDDNKSIDSLISYSWDVEEGEFSDNYWLQNLFYTQLTSSIESAEEKANILTLSPNPVSDFISLKTAASADYSIFTFTGKRIAMGFYEVGKRINVSLLPPGSYVLTLQGQAAAIKFQKI